MTRNVTGVVLAAGASSRMAPAFKPLLDLCGATLLARCIALYHESGLRDVLVVAGHRADEVAAEAARLGADTVHNAAWREGGMFSSVLVALAELERRGTPDAALLLPVDAALVRPLTVRMLTERTGQAERIGQTPGQALLPVFGGRWGHPPLLDRQLFAPVLADSGEGGLRGALQRLGPDRLVEVPVPDRFVLRDMDTPQDHAQACAEWPVRAVPTPEEARALLAVRAVPCAGVAHAEGVAAVALRIARALAAAGVRLDLSLVEAAALLHDIAKGQPRHEQAGGELLRALGFGGVADIVAAHRDVDIAPGMPVTEREVVYFADKLVRCHTLVSVEERFGEKLAQWRHDPQAAAAIRGRMDRALGLRARLERDAGLSLADMLHPLRSGQPVGEGGACRVEPCPGVTGSGEAGPGEPCSGRGAGGKAQGGGSA